jgi:hypothetical protein
LHVGPGNCISPHWGHLTPKLIDPSPSRPYTEYVGPGEQKESGLGERMVAAQGPLST